MSGKLKFIYKSGRINKLKIKLALIGKQFIIELIFLLSSEMLIKNAFLVKCRLSANFNTNVIKKYFFWSIKHNQDFIWNRVIKLIYKNVLSVVINRYDGVICTGNRFMGVNKRCQMAPFAQFEVIFSTTFKIPRIKE